MMQTGTVIIMKLGPILDFNRGPPFKITTSEQKKNPNAFVLKIN